ncbi:hypothetical protein [Agrococcus terreus]|uniref:Beta/Gamma crystallin n=1 Tax=Agrococcus terreus TaxID=574649 RepID=A0ABQ2KGT5_9MICO|nr:hypothetical protein [Agrococcus terreus]GGN81434.1 hypothetical protein GCM10010968_10240 [Agrococcus terreus]
MKSLRSAALVVLAAAAMVFGVATPAHAGTIPVRRFVCSPGSLPQVTFQVGANWLGIVDIGLYGGTTAYTGARNYLYSFRSAGTFRHTAAASNYWMAAHGAGDIRVTGVRCIRAV